MKKLILVLFITVMLTGFASAQEIGIRWGDIVGNDVAVDAVFGVGGQRIHADLSFGSSLGLEVLSDFIVAPLSGEAFYYYVGAGAFAWFGDPFQLGVLGELGLEYRFNGVPIALGLDWRPSFRIIDNTKFHADRFGLNVRWVF